jgi:hypothetical protein
VVIVIPLIVVACVVATGCLKGRYAMSIVGLFGLLGIPAILASVRLAREDSWWAKHFYDDLKLRRAAHRYPGNNRVGDALTL